MFIHNTIYIYIYIHIVIGRERERERERPTSLPRCALPRTDPSPESFSRLARDWGLPNVIFAFLFVCRSAAIYHNLFRTCLDI